MSGFEESIVGFQRARGFKFNPRWRDNIVLDLWKKCVANGSGAMSEEAKDSEIKLRR